MSIGGGAQRETVADESQLLLTGTDGAAGSGLKQAVAERLAAHRNRRATEQAHAEESQAMAMARAERVRKESRRGASLVRDAVAARYEQSQSYREFLAAEAERAIQQAQAEAEVAALTMRAVAEAQQKLLDELAEYDRPKLVVSEFVPEPMKAEIRSELAHELADIVLGAQELIAEPIGLSIVEQPMISEAAPAISMPVGKVSVRMPEEFAAKSRTDSVRQSRIVEQSPEELAELEDEIAFRLAPEFAPMAMELTPIPANIIEFPRQLIAPRKARPRLAEGPLMDEPQAETSAASPQLRIFEVEADQVAIEPEPVESFQGAPEWQSLLLESYVSVEHPTPNEAQAQFTFTPQPAPMQRRVIAVAVDGMCVATAYLLFATAVAYICGPNLAASKASTLAGASAAVIALFYLAYQMLFFTFSDATPGMRYAHIALCTFGDDYPTRKEMRRRTLANLLAACPLGLGFAWVLLDNDRLGWHDRISRMYQRAY
ncbi:MAG: RDD family protein [Acidobacteriaceae bacterium]|nr:RDD family protein [Acidobacteriaceae bacterium]